MSARSLAVLAGLFHLWLQHGMRDGGMEWFPAAMSPG